MCDIFCFLQQKLSIIFPGEPHYVQFPGAPSPLRSFASNDLQVGMFSGQLNGTILDT